MKRQVAFLGAVALLAALTAVLLGVEAVRARGSLLSAASAAQAVKGHLVLGDVAAAGAELDLMQRSARSAVAATDGPHWALAARVPLLGPTVSAVRTIAAEVERIAAAAEPALAVAASARPEAVLPRDGAIDLRPLVLAGPPLESLELAAQEASSALAEVDRPGLLPAVAGPLGELRSNVTELAAATVVAADAARLLPGMLGADGPRRYAVLVQNNAEPRATGGLPGAVVLLVADGGRLRLEATIAGARVQAGRTVLPLLEHETHLGSDKFGRWLVDANFTPDFPRTAELSRELLAGYTGSAPVDGVLSVDPVTLQGLLAATGDVEAPGGVVLTSADAAAVLLNRTYLEIENPKEQDEFFAAAAGSVFEAMTGGEADAGAALEALTAAVGAGRLMAWSAREDEQHLLREAGLAGELRGQIDSAPVVGVYLNDRTFAKMGWYQRRRVSVSPAECAPDGSRRVLVAVTLENVAPLDAATSLPAYVTGGGVYVPEGRIRTVVLVYGPSGGLVGEVERAGEHLPAVRFRHHGLEAAAATVELGPGESATLTASVVIPAGLPGAAVLRVTPGPTPAAVENRDEGC